MSDPTRYVSLRAEFDTLVVRLAQEVAENAKAIASGASPPPGELPGLLRTFAERLDQADAAVRAAAILHRRAWCPELSQFLPDMEVGLYLARNRKRYLRYGHLQALDAALAPLRADAGANITLDKTYPLPDDPPGQGGPHVG